MKDPQMLTCRVPQQLLYKLQDCADERDTTVSELLREMIKRSVRRYSANRKKHPEQMGNIDCRGV